MIKKIFFILIYFLSFSSFACDRALPTNDVNFCSSFKSVATSYCTSYGLPRGMCQDMKTLYNRLLARYGSLEKACEGQKHTDAQDCLDNWKCYRLGGIDSRNRLCNSTKKACE